MERRLVASEASRPVAALMVKASPVRTAAVPPDTSDEPEGEVVTPTTILEIAPGAADGEGPQWPDDAAEVAFLSEQRTNGTPVLPQVPAASESHAPLAEPPELANAPLPPLQTLVDRIPAEARDVLEDLFRARFVSVKRVHTTALK